MCLLLARFPLDFAIIREGAITDFALTKKLLFLPTMVNAKIRNAKIGKSAAQCFA